MGKDLHHNDACHDHSYGGHGHPSFEGDCAWPCHDNEPHSGQAGKQKNQRQAQGVLDVRREFTALVAVSDELSPLEVEMDHKTSFGLPLPPACCSIKGSTTVTAREEETLASAASRLRSSSFN